MDEISNGVDGFLAQAKIGMASMIFLVYLIHVQFLNFGYKNRKSTERVTKLSG
jgi:hypothetical protein